MTVYFIEFEDLSYFDKSRLNILNRKYKGNTGKNFNFIGANTDITLYSYIQMAHSWNSNSFEFKGTSPGSRPH